MLDQVLVAFLLMKRAVVVDAPLLMESGLDRLMTRTVVVFCSPETERKRLLLRDGDVLSEEDADQRIKAQMPLNIKAARATHVIDNEGSMEDTKAAALRILQRAMPSFPSVLFFWLILAPLALPSLILLKLYRFVFER